MGSVSEILATVPGEAWFLFTLGALARTVRQLWPHVRHGYYKSRLERRFTREVTLTREEVNCYRLSMGEEREPLEIWPLIDRALLEGLIGGAPPWAAATFLKGTWGHALGPLLGVFLVAVTWRWLGEREERPPFWSRAHIPREALIGFGAAMIIVAVLLGSMLKLF